MTGSDIALIITACGSSIAAILSAWGVMISTRNQKQIGVVNEKVENVHSLTKQVQVETNGMKDELVAEVRASSFARGVKSETDKQL